MSICRKKLPCLDEDDEEVSEDEVENLLKEVDDSEMPDIVLKPGEGDYDYKNYVTDNSLLEESPYLKSLFKGCKLEVLNKHRVYKKFRSHGPGGLIDLFLQTRFLKAITLWTNQSLHSKGKHEINYEYIKNLLVWKLLCPSFASTRLRITGLTRFF